MESRTQADETAVVKRVFVTAWLWLSSLRLAPHILLLLASSRRAIIALDVARWGEVLHSEKPRSQGERIALFVRLMTFNTEYRNLFYYRTGWPGRMLAILCPPNPTLFLRARKIGPGLFIQHGFSTSIAAVEIGENCWINQQVTVGFSNATDCPTIGNNVTIYPGARVFGKISIGENSTIGANAVVAKNVPPNSTVVGVPAYIVRKDGVRVRLPL